MERPKKQRADKARLTDSESEENGAEVWEGDEDSEDSNDEGTAASSALAVAQKEADWKKFRFIDDEAEQSDDDIDGEDGYGDEDEDFGGFFVDDDEVESEPDVGFGGGIDPIDAARRKKAARRQQKRDAEERRRRRREVAASRSSEGSVEGSHRKRTQDDIHRDVRTSLLRSTPSSGERRVKRARSAEPVLSPEPGSRSALPSGFGSPASRKSAGGTVAARGGKPLAGSKKGSRGSTAPKDPDLKTQYKRLRMRLLEANMGKVPDNRAGRAVFLELEQFTPTSKDLQIAMSLITALTKVKNTSASEKQRSHAKRIYKYWKAIASGKTATLHRRCTKEQAKTESKSSKFRLSLGKARAGAKPWGANGVQSSPSRAPPAKKGGTARGGAPPRANPSQSRAHAPVARGSASVGVGQRRPGVKAKGAAGPGPGGAKGKAPPREQESLLKQTSTIEFRHQWPGLHRKITMALDEKPPNVERALASLRKLKAARPQRSILEEAIKGGLVADLKAFRKHSDKRVSTACTELYQTYKDFMS